MAGLIIKSYGSPDETRPFPQGHIDLFTLGETTVGRFALEPGWRWSKVIGPMVKTKSCEISHCGYCVAGRLKVVMDDGEEAEIGPGDTFEIGSGHDAYVVGDEAFISYDFTGAKEYARPSQPAEPSAPPSIH